MSEDRYPLGEPTAKPAEPEPEWLKRLKARRAGENPMPAGIAKQEDGKFETVGHKPPGPDWMAP